MTIRKQEFYEGAALYLLARTGGVKGIEYEAPFFLINDELFLYLKYSTKGRSPWGFTFMPEEQRLLQKRISRHDIIIGLICGNDGVAALPYDGFQSIAGPKTSAQHISCYRNHGEHYEISGPDGKLKRKVAPSNWERILDR
jgi:hypothetical protein